MGPVRQNPQHQVIRSNNLTNTVMQVLENDFYQHTINERNTFPTEIVDFSSPPSFKSTANLVDFPLFPK